MKVYRIAGRGNDPRTGWGARRWGGRWNSPGRAVIYTASSLALACLEVLVNIQNPANMPDYAFWEIDVPEWTIGRGSAPDPFLHNLEETRRFGDAWLAKAADASRPARYLRWKTRLRKPHNTHPVLQVPSIIILPEYNYLISPDHPQFSEIKWSNSRQFRFDSRLLFIR